MLRHNIVCSLLYSQILAHVYKVKLGQRPDHALFSLPLAVSHILSKLYILYIFFHAALNRFMLSDQFI